jgi:hypothetical protein
MSNCNAATNGDATSDSTIFNGHPVVSGGVVSNSQDISTSQVLSNGYVSLNGLGALEERSVAGDETTRDDILFCNLTKISKEIIEVPAKYIQSLPSKGVRSKVIMA